MHPYGFAFFDLLVPALAALVSAALTYLATRRGHEVSERGVYIGAVDQVTRLLRGELRRAVAARRAAEEHARRLEHRLFDLEAELHLLRSQHGAPGDDRPLRSLPPTPHE